MSSSYSNLESSIDVEAGALPQLSPEATHNFGADGVAEAGLHPNEQSIKASRRSSVTQDMTGMFSFFTHKSLHLLAPPSGNHLFGGSSI
jgi:hypothetical protein